MDKKRAQAELHYRLSNWIVIDLIKKQLLTETEAAQILKKRMENLEPSAGFRLFFEKLLTWS